jgi:DNA-binding HxlR family transcriptional regulator
MDIARDQARPASPLATALDAVGDRWSLLVVEALLDGPLRFGELQAALPAIAPNILTDRLRRLTRERLVVATPYSRRPPRSAYGLTSDGRDLAGALRLLTDWAARREGAGEPLRHAVCGSPLEAHWFCPTCGSRVEEGEAGDVAHV